VRGDHAEVVQLLMQLGGKVRATSGALVDLQTTPLSRRAHVRGSESLHHVENAHDLLLVAFCANLAGAAACGAVGAESPITQSARPVAASEEIPAAASMCSYISDERSSSCRVPCVSVSIDVYLP